MGFFKKIKKKVKKASKKVNLSKAKKKLKVINLSKAVDFLPNEGEKVLTITGDVAECAASCPLLQPQSLTRDILDASIVAAEQAQKASVDARVYARVAAKEAAKAASDAAELRSIMVEFRRCPVCKKIFCQCPGGN
jgi:predicted HAD superfamily hydrolase